ncbi:MAG TPA: signal peptidase [Bacteroidia bacterium]|jgi:hypothetical protein|nr:signal peptidase [Bacteroidia bacterium]
MKRIAVMIALLAFAGNLIAQDAAPKAPAAKPAPAAEKKDGKKGHHHHEHGKGDHKGDHKKK